MMTSENVIADTAAQLTNVFNSSVAMNADTTNNNNPFFTGQAQESSTSPPSPGATKNPGSAMLNENQQPQQAPMINTIDANNAASANVATWIASFAAYQQAMAAQQTAAVVQRQPQDGTGHTPMLVDPTSLMGTTPPPSSSTAAAALHQPHRPTYVNAKQYRRILKRREARRVLEEYYQRRRAAAAQKKPYMHESRHRHAMKRPRGPGGRFLTKEELVEYYKQHPEHDPQRMTASSAMDHDHFGSSSTSECSTGGDGGGGDSPVADESEGKKQRIDML